MKANSSARNANRLQALAAAFLMASNLTPATPAQQAQAPAQQTVQTTGTQVPFNEIMQHSHNPIGPYRGQIVAPPSLGNSSRINLLAKDGKIYLSLRDAIDLALEDNLDLVIARYNLPIAQTDLLRTAAGGSVRGVNTGVVSGTPGGSAGGSGSGTGAGGTSAGAGGAGAGASGIVSSTLGAGTSVSSYDPQISAKAYVDHTSELLTNQQLYGTPTYHVNNIEADVSYYQAFATGGSVQVDWYNNRQTSNSQYNSLNPQLYAYTRVLVQQQVLAGFGFGPNLRYLRIARTNQKIGDIAFRAQIIATVTQICNIYWDLVQAYDTEQVGERTVGFAQDTLDKSRKQLELQAIPAMDVLKAEGDLALRQQELAVARKNLQLQELYMKNAITRSLDDFALEEMPIVPTDHIATTLLPESTPMADLLAGALKNRTELLESALVMQNTELSRKTARNALLPSLTFYGLYAGSGYGGTPNPLYEGTVNAPDNYGGTLQNALNNSSPEYQVGFQLNVTVRNRVAKADQYRAELEYRQSQVRAEELKKQIRIEVRNARYSLEQGAAQVDAARKARDLAAKTLDIMQKEQQLGAGSNQQTLSADHDLAVAESALVKAETDYEKARIELKRATGSILEDYGISIADARSGVVGAQSSAAPVQ